MDNPILEKRTQEHINEIQAALQKLASSPLPEESLASIRQAMDSLSSLSQVILSNQEETTGAVRQAQEERNQFISHVTHELRLPMTSIKGYTDLLRQGLAGPLNQQQLSFLDTIRNNVERMSALLSDLSDISRIDGGRLRLDLGIVEIQQAVATALDSLHLLQEQKGQIITFHFPADLPPVWSDPNRVVQILTCLLRNAIMYTPEGGEITIRARPQDDEVSIQVKDTGIGISLEDQARLFSPFFRSDEPAVRELHGWGLSLHLCARLVQMMSGEMGADSTPGSGSKFWFTLPQAKSLTSQEPDG